MSRSTDRTRASFGYEWTTFDQLHDEHHDYWRRYLAGVPLAALGDQVGLDAGCGMARYSRFTAPHLRHLVCMDSSEAVGPAARTLAEVEGTSIVRADIMDPPFATGSFGFVQSLGVLHHLEDPEAGFRSLLGLLRPGGVMVLYLYSRPDTAGVRSAALRAAALSRRLTVHLPFRLLRALAWPLAALLYGAVVVPGEVGRRRGVARLASLPLQAYRGKPLRVLWLDTFDRLSAPEEHRYTWATLAPWFAGADVLHARDESGWHVVLEKPAATPAAGDGR